MLKNAFLNKYGAYILYSLIFALLLIPWAYFDEAKFDYSFTPRKILYFMLGLFSSLLILQQKWQWKRIFLFIGALAFFGLHNYLNGYYESHYILQFFYLEIALLVVFAPDKVKRNFAKYSHYILYAFLLKAIFLRIGGFIHGGFLSSNLYATYLVYFCFIEIYQKRYWNLIPAIAVIYLAGSKAAYIAVLLLITLYALQKILEKTQIYAKVFQTLKKFNFYWSLGLAAGLILIVTIIISSTAYYHHWLAIMEPQRQQITELNMLRYGLSTDPADENMRVKDLLAKQQFFKDKGMIAEGPMISDVPTSLGLRINQYDYIHDHIFDYTIVGDTIGSQIQIFGHNPHSAVVDFISRLGLIYLILILFFYKKIFTSFNLIVCNISLIPILAFQPYGFTIGHSLPILCLLYGLAQISSKDHTAEER